MAEFNDASDLGKELFEAVCSDDVELVERLIELGADINWQNPNRGNKSPLHEAAMKQNVEIVNVLISRGCSLNLLTKNMSSPLRLAKISGSNETARLLKEAGAEDIGKQKKEEIRKSIHEWKSELLLEETDLESRSISTKETRKRKIDELKDTTDTSTCPSSQTIYAIEFESENETSKRRKRDISDLQYIQRFENKIDVLIYDSKAMKLRFKQSNEKMQEHINRIERRQALTEKRIQQLQSGVGDKPVILNTCELIDIFEVHNDNFLHMVDSFDSSIFRRYRSTAILSPYDLLYDSRLEWKIQLCTLLRFSKCPDFMISEEPQVEVEEALNYAFLSVAASDKETFDNILAAHILLTKGANINFMNPEGKTALHLATIKKKSIFCRWLLAQKQFEFSNKAYKMFLSFAINLNAKDILRSIAWFICRKLHKQYHKYCIYLDVWPGYRCHAPPYTSRLSETDMHLIAQYKEMNCEKIKEMHGIKVEWRDKDLVSSEGKYISFIEDTSSVQSVKTTNRLIQNKTVADLFKRHSNLNVVSPSTVKSQNFHDIKSRSIKSQLCIALYCRIKGFIPLDEQPFPSSINGIPTDVREGYCTFGGCGPKDVQQNLKIDCCIGPSNDITSGTLGGFVEIDNTTCFITCAHILFDLHELSSNQCSRIVSVVQPTLPNSPHTQAQRTVGSVKNVVFSPDDHNRISVDAALVTLNTRCPSDGKFSRGDELQHKSTGYKAKRSPAFNNGRIMQTIKKKHRRKQVIKFGAESGLTIGSLNLCETHVRMENRDLVLKDYFHGTNTEKKFIMYHQYEVFSSRNTPFFVPGDSGAFVFMTVDKRTNDLQCIGMAIGQTSHNTCLVTPIGALLESFGLPLQLKEFDVQMDNKKCKKKTPVSSSDNTQGLATSVQLDKMFEGFMNTFKAEMQTVKKEMKDDIGIVKQEIDSISNRLDCIENKLQNE